MFIVDLGAESYYSFFGLTPDATAEEIRAARDRMFRDVEMQRRTADPAEARRLEQKQQEIGAKGDTLARPQKRAEYDRANAHLRLFVVRPAAAPMYLSKADRLFALDRVVRDFLAGAGVDVPPLSDIDRRDFTADYTRNDLLEELLK